MCTSVEDQGDDVSMALDQSKELIGSCSTRSLREDVDVVSRTGSMITACFVLGSSTIYWVVLVTFARSS